MRGLWALYAVLCGYWEVCDWVTRVSLSDWLALWARIRGFKNPRLLRDRPTDGAALAARIHAGQVMAVFDRFFG